MDQQTFADFQEMFLIIYGPFLWWIWVLLLVSSAVLVVLFVFLAFYRRSQRR